MNADKAILDAVEAGLSGDKNRARQILSDLLNNDPMNARAWYLLSQVVDTKDRSIECLQRALKIDPNNQQIKNRLDKLQFPEIATIPLQPPVAATYIPANPQTKERKWYREYWFKVFTFLFVTPLWVFIVLDDPESPNTVKIAAGILLIVYVLGISLLFCSGFLWNSSDSLLY